MADYRRPTPRGEPERASGEPSTRASAVYEQLRNDMRLGKFTPGAPLRIEMLMQTYGVGRSPVREALNRLASENLISQADQRGFWLPPVSLKDLDELTRTRCWIYEIGLRESIANATVEWEEEVVLAYHRLSRESRFKPAAPELNPVHERLHRAFHATLISQCRSQWLEFLAERLFDLTDRYRVLAALTAPPDDRDAVSEHKAIADAILAHDTARAIALTNAHIWKTAELVKRSGSVS